jgi:hypothetical protein
VHIFPNVNVRGLYSDQSSGMRNGLSSSRRYRCAYQNRKLLVEEALNFGPRFSEGALDFRLDDVRVLGMGGSNVKMTLACLHSWHGGLSICDMSLMLLYGEWFFLSFVLQ